ncbi:pyocin activator protein prtN [Caudoviricetes sp.]|nr:pyocin activator protein prtN [Caudoviricetes sp.]
MTTAEVAALFRVHRNTLYAIPGLASCRVATGVRVVRYDARKVEALLERRKASAKAA